MGLSYQQLGSLLIPIVVEKLPNVLKLHLGRKKKKKNWDIELVLQCFNFDIIARENYQYLSQTVGKVNLKVQICFTQDSKPENKSIVYFAKRITITVISVK